MLFDRHFCGVVGGLTSYYLIAAPHHFEMISEPLSQAAFMLALGGTMALFITVLLMLTFEVSHPPACATTLIISLGILSSWQQATVIMAAVVIMYLSYRLYLAVGNWTFTSSV